MDEQKRLLLALGLIAALVMLMTVLWPAAQSTAPSPGPESDRRTAEVEPEQDAGSADAAAPDAAAAEAPGEPEPAEAGAPREVRPERRVALETSQLEVEITTHGGGLTTARLLDPTYKERGGADAPQIDLVAVDVEARPELQPLAFSLVRRDFPAPAATGTAEGQGVLRFLNQGSPGAERIAAATDLGEDVAARLARGSPYATLEDVGRAIQGSPAQRERVLGRLLAAAWAEGFVRLDFEVVSEAEDRVVLRGRTDTGIEVTRSYEVVSPFELRVVDRMRNGSRARVELRERLVATGLERREGGGFLFGRPTGLIRGLCLAGDEMVRRDRAVLSGEGGGCGSMMSCGGAPGPAGRTGNIRFAAAEQHYFMTAMSPGPSWADSSCLLRASPDGTLVVEIEPAVFTELQPGASTAYAATVFLGPKQFDLLKQLGPGRRLWEAIDYGWFAFLSHWLLWALRLFHGWFGNWGLAVIFLTFLIKLILLPVTHKTFKNMRVMQQDMARLKPELDELNKRYKDQPDVKQQKTLELYQAHGINPLKQVSGCLPMFLQMPIWIALYRMISESVELYRAPFFWWLDDLSAQDPYYILPGLLGLSMFLQQHITPQPGMDSAQARMMKWMMPAMFLFIMLNMPSGLVLYIFVNTLLTLVQQQFINRLVPATAPVAGKGASAPGRPGGEKHPAGDSDEDEGDEAGRARRKSKQRRRKRK